ncbi:hypothetical protein O3M35_000675 [Rhynocoris fuscipes]|uniref:Latrotoxin C-terminal domain-containing protein n=1 Tax=Rhynocoris fuscipes TaxID=488301 RepID=A0AAW1DT71_9HEMI
MLPLVDIPNLTTKLNILYDGSARDVFGIGWSLPQNFIVLDHQSSIFPEDSKYYLVYHNVFQELIFDSKTSTEYIYKFKLKNTSSKMSLMEISYYKIDERWEVKTGDLIQIYGGIDKDAVLKENTWINWRGVGSSSKGKMELAEGWYLSKVSDQYNNTLHYSYFQVNAGNTINLTYKQISDDEIKKKSGKSINRLYVDQCSVNTACITQEINFVYTLNNNNRLLTSIIQNNNKPVLKFSYNKDNLMNKLTFLNRVTALYNYNSIGKLFSLPRYSHEEVFMVNKNYKIFYENNYTIISYVNSNGYIVLKIFNDKMDKELYSSFSNYDIRRLPLLGKHEIIYYEIFTGNNYFAVRLWYDGKIDLYLFGWDSSEVLSSPANYMFTDQVIIRPTRDFIVISDIDSKPMLIEWNINEKQWITKTLCNNNSNILLYSIAAFGGIVLIYDNQYLIIWYKNNNDEWINKIIKYLPNFLTNIKGALNRFNLKNQRTNYYYYESRSSILQISKNLILLSTWGLNGSQIYSKINLFVLNNKHEIALEQTKEIQHENLQTFTTNYTDQSGNKYYSRYIQEGNKFHVKVDSFEGPNKDRFDEAVRNATKEIKDAGMPRYKEKEKLKELHKIMDDNLNELKKNISEELEKNVLLLNNQNYLGTLRAPILISDNLKFNFTGTEWNIEKIEKKKKNDLFEMLGDRFMLYQSDASSTIKLYGINNKYLIDLQVKHFNQTLNRYPIYLAYQRDNSNAHIVQFTNNGIVSELYSLPIQEKLSYFSGFQGVFTEIPYKEGLNLIYRSLNGLKRLISNSVITLSTLIYDNNMRRITGYEYNSINAKPMEDSIFFEQSKLIPANDKKSFGWIEETFLSNSSTKVIYNGNGEAVKTNIREFTDKEDEESDNIPRNSTIFDKSNKLPVAYFFPFNIESELVSYYGFEDYEVNSIGIYNGINLNKWIMNDTNIKRNQFSFTGTNYLQLNSGESLTAKFNLSNNNITFIASTWLRPQFEMPDVGSTTPYLKIIASTENVRLQSGPWYYLESIINLYYARLEINESNSTLDVDHVRFTPISCRFRANVYNSNTKSLKEEIQFNGLVKRYIYDKYQEKIATINEYGQLTEFTTYTKVTSNDFRISPGYLHHTSVSSDILSLRKSAVNPNSYGLRIIYTLKSKNAKITFNNAFCILQSNEGGLFTDMGKQSVAPISGELVIIVEKSRIFIWLDGGLYVDSGNVDFNSKFDSSLVDIEVEGSVLMKDVMIFNDINVSVTYFNSLGEKIQDIKLEDEDKVVVTEFLYDPIGRQSITTKPIRIKREKAHKMLAHYSSLVVNSNPYLEDSVWKTGILKGERVGNATIGEYDYSEIKYYNDVLEEERLVGYPGKEFSTFGPFAKKFGTKCNILFLRNLYPPDEGYRYRTEYKSGGVLEISVLDSKENNVARFIHVPAGQDLLSTYEYDGNNKLVKLLPPLYHEKAKTFFKLYPELHSTSTEERELQMLLGTHLTYDDTGNILTKKTCDSGKVENVFDKYGLLKFVVYYNFQDDRKVDKIIYFNYDTFFRVQNSGLLTTSVPVNRLLDTIHNNTKSYQEFYYNDADSEPTVRGRVLKTITFNEQVPFFEEFQIDDQEHTVNKRITIPINEDKPLYVEVNKRYVGDKLKDVAYPIEFQNEPFVLTYGYNKLGKIQSIGVPNNISIFYSFAYNPSGQIIREVHCPNSIYSFTRHYSYNSPGFLTSLEDKYLTEHIVYTEPGYGGFGYGDGTITRVEFQATWHNSSTNDYIALNEQSFLNRNINAYDSKLCFNKLKEAGYIDNLNHQKKIFYPQLELNTPIICSYGTNGRYISSILGQKGFPSRYGHTYDYGNHLELTKAKYFVGAELPSPLQPDIFARDIPALNGNTTLSNKIWQILKDSRYIIQDQDKDNLSKAHAKRGKTFISSSLAKDLKSIDADFSMYLLNIAQLLTNYFADSKTLSLSDFINIFSKWKDNKNLSSKDRNAPIVIFKMLEKNNYLKNPLSKEFVTALKEFPEIVPDIVRILRIYFGKELGEAEFDVESFGIDANGNHKHYYTGFDRFEINYKNNTNRIEAVKFKSFSVSTPEQIFPVEHDSSGNIVQAMHKRIKQIEYDPVLNRASKIHLIDGRCLTFAYDSHGERILKKVENKQGHVTKEVHYIRDEHGRSLVERELNYLSAEKPPVLLTTAYIYGPLGLIGFIRRDEFYSVVCDHENSIRLVIKNGEVVAAYDYLPYGNMMREFATYPEAHISYRYTGQEWDEELGLYNYHARFYDPSIGRFYQIDPKAQYFSPYKYAGNSPVSIVDPDGEFAFLIPIFIGLFAVAGAYLGGAAANGTFDLTKWNWKSSKTWLGIFGGAVGGGLLPVGFVGSVAVLGGGIAAYSATFALGMVGAYISTAAANGEWNFTKWDFSSPETWNAIFSGFGLGSGAVVGFKDVRSFYLSLTKTGKAIFIGSTVVSGAALFTVQGVATNWDLSKPEFWFGVVGVVVGAADMPMFLRGATRFLKKNGRIIGQNFKKIRKFIAQEKNYFSHFSKMKSEWIPIVKSSAEILSGAVVTGLSSYLVGSAVNGDFKNWDMASVGTYFGVLDGMLAGGQLGSSGKHFYKAYKMKKKTKLSKKLEKITENIASTTIEEYKNILEAISIKLGYKKRESSFLSIDDYKRYEKLVVNIQKKDYSKESLQHIREGDIPNTAIAVGITDKYIISAFSSNEAPGLVMYFNHKKMSSPSILHEQFLDVNLKIAGKKVALSDDSARNKYLMNSIEETRKGIIQKKIIQFASEEENFKNILASFPGMSDDIDNIIFSLKTIITKNGYLIEGKNSLKNILSQPINKAIQKRTAEMRNYILEQNREYKNKMDQLRNPIFKDRHESLKEETRKLRDHIDEKKKELQKFEKKIITERDKMVNSIWEKLEKYEEGFTFWSPINCAEPHVLSANARMEEILKGADSSFKEKVSDIKFLGTYKVRDSLLPFERCDHCKITTSHIKNIVTDPEWNEILNGNLLKLANDKKTSSIQRLYFLLPYAAMLNPFLQVNTGNEHYRNDTNIKVKRSLDSNSPKKWTMIENEDYKFTESSTSGAATNMPFITNLFSWLKRTYNDYVSNDENISHEQQFDNEGVFKNSHSLFDKRWEDMINVQSALLLANVFVAKFFNTRLSFNTNHNDLINDTDALAHAINIVDRFENDVTRAAIEFQLPEKILTCLDFFEVQKLIMPKIISNRFQEIFDILNRYLISIYPDDKLNKYELINRKNFFNKMTENINILMNNFFVEIFDENKSDQTVDSFENHKEFEQRNNYMSGLMTDSPKTGVHFFPSDIINVQDFL